MILESILLIFRFSLLKQSISNKPKQVAFTNEPAQQQKQEKKFIYKEKSLVELSPDVNFINFLRAHFSYEHHFSSFFQLHVHCKNFRNDINTKNSYVKMLMKLTPDVCCLMCDPLFSKLFLSQSMFVQVTLREPRNVSYK